jgi:hypothetical protein
MRPISILDQKNAAGKHFRIPDQAGSPSNIRS